MSYNKCPKNNNCKINCLLIVDSMSIFFLIQALINYIENCYSQLSRSDKFDFFCKSISSILEKFSYCSLNKALNISENVYIHEISPTQRLSTLRRKIRDFNTMCRNRNKNFQTVEDIIERFFNIIPIDNSEIIEFMNFFPSSLKIADRDASLLLLGLKKAHDDCKTLILTNDRKIEKAYLSLAKYPSLTFQFGQFNTSMYFFLNYFNFITISHGCCQLSKEEYKNLFHQYCAAEFLRFEDLKKSQQSYIHKNLDKYYFIFLNSIYQKVDKTI
ncbi:hypothetical protein ES703_32775 [subsurface metagenome]